MNKLHKHAECIKAWADGAEIEFSSDGKRWTLYTSQATPSFNVHNYYRIHDPYRELKKAHAAGKVIQFYEIPEHVWTDCKIQPKWDVPPERYRAKPETKTVKMWQWIVKQKGNQYPFLSAGLTPTEPNFTGAEWVRKAPWTEIEVEVNDD